MRDAEAYVVHLQIYVMKLLAVNIFHKNFHYQCLPGPLTHLRNDGVALTKWSTGIPFADITFQIYMLELNSKNQMLHLTEINLVRFLQEG